MTQENNSIEYADDSCMGVKMYGSVVVGTKGQIVIPSEVRRTLHIIPGDSLCVMTKHGKAIALIKMDDMSVFMEYMQQEIDSFKTKITQNPEVSSK